MSEPGCISLAIRRAPTRSRFDYGFETEVPVMPRSGGGWACARLSRDGCAL